MDQESTSRARYPRSEPDPAEPSMIVDSCDRHCHPEVGQYLDGWSRAPGRKPRSPSSLQPSACSRASAARSSGLTVTGRPTTSSGPRPAARRLCRAAVSAATMAHAASLVQGSVSRSRMRPRYAASWVPATRRRPSQLGRSARRCPRPRGSWRPRRVEYPGGILGGILGGAAQALQRSCRGLGGVVGRGQSNALGGEHSAVRDGRHGLGSSARGLGARPSAAGRKGAEHKAR